MTLKASSSYVPYQMVDAGSSGVRSYLAPYLQRWPLFVLSLVLSLAAAYVYLLYKQPIYRIQASLLLQDEKRGNVQSNPLKELEGYSPKKVVENELEVLRSSSLMERVVANLHLDTRYFRKTTFGKREIYTESPIWVYVSSANPAIYKKLIELNFPTPQTVRIDNQNYPLNQLIQTPYGQLRILTRQAIRPAKETIFVQVLPPGSAADMYLGNLKAEPTSKTSAVIHLTLEDAVPQKGQAILNSLINEYNQAAITDKNKVAANTLRFVENRLRMVSGELAGVEKQVEQYKSNLGITDLGAQAQSFLQTSQQNDNQLNQVTIQLAALGELQQFINTRADQRGSTPATVGISDPVLLGQIEKLSQLELQRDQYLQTTSEANPLLQTVDSQIKATKNNISQNIRTMKAMLTSSQEQYQAKNQKLERVIRTVPQQERALVDITRQQTIKNNLYTYLLQKREEMAVSFAATIADSRTIDAAKSSAGPVKPVGIVIYALFGLVGFLVPAAGIAGVTMLNTRVSRRNDVENSTHIPIVGEVMSKRYRDVLVVSSHSQSVIAEQIRAIRTNLHIGHADQTLGQVMLCTSSISGEGKSFISLNLGASLALLRQPTVIIEMDMRMPRLHQLFTVDNSIGLSTYLNGEATLEEILQPLPGHPNYYIIPSGPLPPDPSELLSGFMMKQLLQLLRERFSHVILDAPPIGIVTDAQVLAPYVDTTLFVVRHGVTPKHSLKALDVLYREQRFPNMQIILNAVGNGESYHSNHRYKNSYSYR